MIRQCVDSDLDRIEVIINEAALAYKGKIPDDCWHEPYMPRAGLDAEIAAGVAFSGWEEAGALIGVMGLQQVKDAWLIRHAYVSPQHQGRGIGSRLLTVLTGQVAGRLLVGTWADADWAIRLYERHGFRLVTPEEKIRLLTTYWTISPRQVETSVVLVK